jgi:carbon monoxide dehydrogenase subunit G
MEHESFVPGMTTARVEQALRTPDAVRAALPGWQPDTAEGGEGAEGAAVGRLRLRVGGTTITYRGTVAVGGADDEGPGFTVTAEGAEVRGGGRVTVRARLSVVTAVQPEPGVRLVWSGEAEGTGRVAALEPAAVESAVRRLLDRFCADLAGQAPPAAGVPEAAAGAAAGAAGAAAAQDAPDGTGGAAREDDAGESGRDAEPGDEAEPDAEEGTPEAGPDGTPEAAPEDDAPEFGRDAGRDDEAEVAPEAAPEDDTPEAEPDDEPDAGPDDEPEADVVDDLGEPVTPAELDDFDLVEVEVEVPESAAALDDLVPPAEAAHARRTMIGRSAEEVDHAPPRGRYAPVPAPDSSSAAAALRWAAPVAAALVASAVVVGRVLRRRG